jgi:hypothetical protein
MTYFFRRPVTNTKAPPYKNIYFFTKFYIKISVLENPAQQNHALKINMA